MGYVEIPVIDVNLPIHHTVAESSLQKGAGHMPGTSLPIGGKSTHAVISAHSGMSDARMFTDLDKVQKGDLILLHVLGDTLAICGRHDHRHRSCRHRSHRDPAGQRPL